MPSNFETRFRARRLMLQHIVEVLQADKRFTAAWLTGSLGRQGGDSLSDIDISVVVDASHAPTLCQRPWRVAGRTTADRLAVFQQFGEPVIIHENHHNVAGEGTFTSVTYRAEALTVDWTLLADGDLFQPATSLLLFSKAHYPFQQTAPSPSQPERAQAASEQVAFFWMMSTVAAKYMLRQDIVFFHILLDGLHRTLSEVSRLIEGSPVIYQSGSQARLALTYHEQRAAIQALCAQMETLMPALVALGGYVPPDPKVAVDYLLNLMPLDNVSAS